jgi:hypothetical protein
MSGYWQSERYFLYIEDLIRGEIVPQEDEFLEKTVLPRRVSSFDTVSIHIRRGDYERLGWTLPESYYQDALDWILSRLDNPALLVFSDDPEYVKNVLYESVLSGLGVTIEFVKGNNAVEDLWLMRACDHHVIANSTFSWWGAWLNPNRSKRVVAPGYWLSNDTKELDIIPNSWKRIYW